MASRSAASDLLYATQTKREAFAAYTQAAIELNEKFTLTLGIRYAEDKLMPKKTYGAIQKLVQLQADSLDCMADWHRSILQMVD